MQIEYFLVKLNQEETKMTPRQAYIAACIEMVEINDELTAEELSVSQEILKNKESQIKNLTK